MSRGNVFKLSGNMALGGGTDNYQAEIEGVKNSLKLLKSKQNQRRTAETEPYNYGGQIGQKDYGYKNGYDFDSFAKNNLPSHKEISSQNYGAKKYTGEISSQYRNEQYNYSKPSSYSQQPPRNMPKKTKPSVQEKYDPYPRVEKNVRTPSTMNYSKQSYRQKGPQHHNYEDQYYNPREQMTLKEANRENQAEIKEYDPSQLRECRMGCGRKFNPDSIAKHEAICKKVFQKKRKEFNSQQHRIVNGDQKKLMKKGEIVERKIENSKKTEKIPKWKAESLQFRSVLKQNRNAEMSVQQKQMMEQANEMDRVKCHICGRKFNTEAATRHIKFCEEQAKKNALKRKK